MKPVRTERAGWTRLSPVGSKTNQHWRQDASGWEVMHCGHMTANWPYYAIDPAFPDRSVVSFNGLGFKSLDVAIEVVNRVLAGELVATNDNCGERTRRVLVLCTGESVP